MSYNSDSQTMDAALEASEGSGDESPESGLGDGGFFGKYCFADGKYKQSCQNCPGLVCNLIR